jgi:hypothetical protein
VSSRTAQFDVEVPGGGKLTLADAEEVDLWNTAAEDYIAEYGFSKVNDLLVLGMILTFRLHIHREQRKMADEKTAAAASKQILVLAGEMRDLEKQLGIDKKSREAGGQHTVIDYLTKLKHAAHEMGIHINERVGKYEAVAMKAREKIRMLRNLDLEDRRHHDISEGSIISWLERELADLEEVDREFAKTKARLWLGRL